MICDNGKHKSLTGAHCPECGRQFCFDCFAKHPCEVANIARLREEQGRFDLVGNVNGLLKMTAELGGRP